MIELFGGSTYAHGHINTMRPPGIGKMGITTSPSSNGNSWTPVVHIENLSLVISGVSLYKSEPGEIVTVTPTIPARFPEIKLLNIVRLDPKKPAGVRFVIPSNQNLSIRGINDWTDLNIDYIQFQGSWGDVYPTVINRHLKRLSYVGTEPSPNIARWNTSNITNMSRFLSGATLQNLGLNNYDTSNVIAMDYTFYNNNAFNKPLNNWDVGKVKTMRSMFNSCRAFNQDIGGWNVGEVTDMQAMFNNCPVFNQNISGWDVSQVTDMATMFQGCSRFNQDLSGWDVRNVTNYVGFDTNTPAWRADFKPKFLV